MKKFCIITMLICPIAVAAILIASCNTDYVMNGKHVYPKYRGQYDAYNDSSDKYSKINTECGRQLYDYYYAKARSTYRLIYPEGNPANFDEPKKSFDTICYPIK